MPRDKQYTVEELKPIIEDKFKSFTLESVTFDEKMGYYIFEGKATIKYTPRDLEHYIETYRLKHG